MADAQRVIILSDGDSDPYADGHEEGTHVVIKQQPDVLDDYPMRRRASDRARERASRAAYFGDRAGLLIATGTAERLMSSRAEADRPNAGGDGTGPGA
jgi:hypothetical protein